ncbi:MAG: SAM-dependent methyltransferase [Bryobacterales bacterium]|nr:SAM-dependent methyltransferase [Bryobacterales bacterium]
MSPLNKVEQLIRDEIALHGPISFERFMEVALYHPQHGYYCRGEKPIGVQGDFYTASQLQPAFGKLMRAYIERLAEERRVPLPRSISEFGAGRGEMEASFAGWEYQAVEVHSPLPLAPVNGAVFGNEFFDALPVQSAVRVDGQYHERLVAWRDSRFVWVTSPEPSAEIAAYAARFRVPPGDGFEFEVHRRGIRFLEDLLSASASALCVFVDYGYGERDWKRFPEGTLMSYQRHRADADVLANAGEKDITAHVPFHALAEVASAMGGQVLRMELLARALMYAGERDEFLLVLDAATEREQFARRQQLKSLLFGLGESFHVIAISK